MEEKRFLRKKKIAVVSKRRGVSDLLRLEAETCRIAVSVTSVLPQDIYEYDAVIYDEWGNEPLSEFVLGSADNLYRIASDGRELGERELSWPAPISVIREIFEGYVEEEGPRVLDKHLGASWIIDEKEKSIIYRNKKIDFTESEWKVLSCLIEAKGEAVSRSTLRTLFDTEDGNITDVYICHLRRKLEEPFGIKVIRTVRGQGYALVLNK